MAPHSSTRAWKIPWMEEPGRLQSMGSLRVGHDFTFTFHFHALEKEMATHSSVLAWRIPGTGEPGGLPSMGSHRVGHNWSDLAAAAAAQKQWVFLVAGQWRICLHCSRHGFDPWVGKIPWRRKWQPLPVFLPGKNPMDRGDWWATVYSVTGVRNDLVTKPQNQWGKKDILFRNLKHLPLD